MKAAAKAHPLRLAPPGAPLVRDAAASPAVPPESFFTVHQGDARRLELLLSRHSSARKPLLTTTITSPPYGGLKNYGHRDQIGFGQRHDEYLLDMRRVFRALHTHTKRDGSLWVVADTLRQRRPEGEVWPIKLLPFELAREAEGEKWLLREIIIWLKDKTLPWSSRGRMRNSFEYILLFVKSDRFKYNVERLREPSDLEQWWVRYPERYNPQGKAPTNVWPVPIPVQGSWANTTIQHACPLPADLIERMLLISTDPGDVALDPFAGSGVVVAEAQRLKRRGLGVELIDEHIQAFHQTVLPEITQRRGTDLLQDLHARSDQLRRTILDCDAWSCVLPHAFQPKKRFPSSSPFVHALQLPRRRPHPSGLVATCRQVSTDFAFTKTKSPLSGFTEISRHRAALRPRGDPQFRVARSLRRLAKAACL